MRYKWRPSSEFPQRVVVTKPIVWSSGALARAYKCMQTAAIAMGVAVLTSLAAAQQPSTPSATARAAPPPTASAGANEYVLGPGDIIKISVFENPDLLTETRVSEGGTITFPLIGKVPVGGLTPAAAEARMAHMLREGKFLIDPQVTVLVEQIHGSQVAALGQFNRPGRYPLETMQMRLSDLMAAAGGIAPTGADTVIFTGHRDGKPVWREIDVSRMFVKNQLDEDFVLQAGDILFVDRFPLFYIYGEVQRPGSYRVERGMTMVQALAAGGGLTPRGTQRGLRVRRPNTKGEMMDIRVDLGDRVQPDDVIYVQEGAF